MMKEKYKNLEKIIFLLLGCILLITLMILTRQTTENKNFYDEKNKALDYSGVDAPGKEYQQITGISDLKQHGFKRITKWRTKRNIFIRWRPGKNIDIPVSTRPILEVLEINYKPLGIEYRGRIIFDDGKLVAQLNRLNKSYIVKEGSRLPGYSVNSLNKDFIKLKDSTGNYIKIKYRQITYTKELVAKIKEHTSNQTQDVNKNSHFLSYKVLDIDEESVLLSKQGQHLRLKKGMVHK